MVDTRRRRLHARPVRLPAPALPGSGSEGMISASGRPPAPLSSGWMIGVGARRGQGGGEVRALEVRAQGSGLRARGGRAAGAPGVGVVGGGWRAGGARGGGGGGAGGGGPGLGARGRGGGTSSLSPGP